jgi:subtilisin family serine protease
MMDVITVGGTDTTDSRAIYSGGLASNFGICLDLWAPGKGVPSLTRTGSVANFDGTSFAAPHVTGAVALYLQSNPSASPATAATYVKSHGTSGALVEATLGVDSPNLMLFAKPAHGCFSWSCTSSTRTCQFSFSCTRVPFNLGYKQLDFGDGTSYYGGSSSVTHTYPAQSIYSPSLSLLPWQAQPDSPASACVNVSQVGVGGCPQNGLTPWQ